MADMVEDMVCTIALSVFGSLKLEHKNAEGQVTRTINLARPWRRITMVDLVAERTGWVFNKEPLAHDDGPMTATIVALARKTFKPIDPETKQEVPQSHVTDRFGAQMILDRLQTISPAEQLVEVYEKLIEPTLIDPCFVTHVPSVAIPLARESEDDPFFADVYELAINGQEISPGYTELNDPDVQEHHLRHQAAPGSDEERQPIDEDFLTALRVGMPPAGGMGLGVDRLVMMLTGAESIRDVILFPLMRPKEADG